ncbi:MAG: 50S ribosomal protein L6 [Robiginitomaculum sp.]|nr:MAG: 50S ribosomal protein L6 [Robiginitomaculum sp.]
MSRIGKQPVELPAGVTGSLDGKTLTVKGPKGELSMTFVKEVKPTLDGAIVSISPIDDSQRAGAMWGMQRTLVANMVEGVLNGYEKNLELHGVGYRATMKGSAVGLQLGFSHDVTYQPPAGITLTVAKPTQIKITGIEKQVVGQTAAEIRSYRPPEPYKGKGVRYVGEYVRRKEGKKK